MSHRLPDEGTSKGMNKFMAMVDLLRFLSSYNLRVPPPARCMDYLEGTNYCQELILPWKLEGYGFACPIHGFQNENYTAERLWRVKLSIYINSLCQSRSIDYEKQSQRMEHRVGGFYPDGCITLNSLRKEMSQAYFGHSRPYRLGERITPQWSMDREVN